MSNLFRRMERKVTELALSKNSDNSSAEIEIKRIEELYNFVFPDDYREFVLNYGGSYFDMDDVYYKSLDIIDFLREDRYGLIYSFYGFGKDESIEKEINTYIGRMPDWLIPISDADGGNQICIGIKGKNINKIFFWDHENELEAKKMLQLEGYEHVDINEYFDNIHLIANSFYDFIMSLENKLRDNSDEDDGIVDFWISEDLLND